MLIRLEKNTCTSLIVLFNCRNSFFADLEYSNAVVYFYVNIFKKLNLEMGLEKFGIYKFYNNDVTTTNSYTLKQKYEDFVVKEINEGSICCESEIFDLKACEEALAYILWLTQNRDNNTDIKTTESSQNNQNIDTDDSNMLVGAVIELGSDIKIRDNQIFYGENVVDFHFFSIKEHFEILSIKNLSKYDRTKVHKKIKLHPLLFTKTKDDGSISIAFGYKKLRYKFTLKKINRDSMSACQYIAKCLNVSFANVRYAGNKDKRAITYQNVTVDCYFVDIYNLALKFQQENQNIKLFDIRQCSSHLKLGELEGNRFEIAIRPIKDGAKLNLNFENMEKGFYNYFGQQRFGMAGTNHIVGKFLLEKNYDAAIKTIMEPCDKDSEVIRDIKNKFKDGNLDIDVKEKELKRSLEGKILLSRIKKNEDRFVFKNLPNELSKLYFHAYQSYKFNCLVNETNQDYIEQVKESSKHLKGNKRAVVERARDLEVGIYEDKVVVAFTLNPGVFATMALREVIGNDVFYEG